MKILYIHGFSSTGNATKANILREYFGKSMVIAPTLPINPIETLSLLNEIIEDENKTIFLVGSSLGGFYANYLRKSMNLPCLLLNPSIKPHLTLKKRIGLGEHFRQGTGEIFVFRQEHIEIFKDLFNELQLIRGDSKLLNVLLCKNDDLLDHSQTLEYLKTVNMLKVLETGGHTMTNFESQMPFVKKIIMNYLE